MLLRFGSKQKFAFGAQAEDLKASVDMSGLTNIDRRCCAGASEIETSRSI
jgi:hypothetical protein